jgi:tetratricopeptide (TPR) repeat protein
MGMKSSNENIALKYRFQDAANLESQGKLLHALQIFYAIYNENPEYTEAAFKIIGIYEKLNNIPAAQNLVSTLLEDYPEEKKIRLFSGQFYFRNSKWNETIEVLSFFLPEEEPITSFFIGYSHYMLQEYEYAKISFLNFLANDKSSEFFPDAYIYLAKLDIHMGDFRTALDYLKKAESFYTNFYELHLLFAITYFFLGMETHSIKSIEKSLKLNVNDTSVIEWAGKIYLKAGNYKLAEGFLRKFISETEQPSPETYSNLAVACLNTNKITDARTYFNIAIHLDPENRLAKEALKNLDQLNQT